MIPLHHGVNNPWPWIFGVIALVGLTLVVILIMTAAISRSWRFWA